MNKHLQQWYEENSLSARALMHRIWQHPETGLDTHYACRETAAFLREHGFISVETHAAEDYDNPDADPNSVVAVWGSGRPVIGIIGELDGLPNLGQEAVPYPSPIPGPGHGCGHNLMAGGSAAAACALRYAMEQEGLAGTLKFVEAPAEEIGLGKSYLARAGVFSDMDLALMWHMGYADLNFNPRCSRAVADVKFEFFGKSAHAGGAPWAGRSALDAVQLMNLGCEFLREHIEKDCLIHYRITDGGAAVNVVPDYASSEYQFRAMSNDGLKELFTRGLRLAHGAATMTETTFRYTIKSIVPHMFENIPLCRYAYEAAQKVPRPAYTEEEYTYARALYRSLHQQEAPEKDEDVVSTAYMPYTPEISGRPITTDAADVSFFCPIIHASGWGTIRNGFGHHWSTTAMTGSALGEKAGLHGYMVMAQTGYDALVNPRIVRDSQDYYRSLNIPDYFEWQKSFREEIGIL